MHMEQARRKFPDKQTELNNSKTKLNSTRPTRRMNFVWYSKPCYWALGEYVSL